MVSLIKKTTSFFFFLFLAKLSIGQTTCDDKSLSRMEKKFEKADKNAKADTYDYADLSFQIAECYRSKNDGKNLYWYTKNTYVSKSAFKYCNKDKLTDCNRTMGQLGISSYYIGHYDESIHFLELALNYSKNPDYNYFLGLSHMKVRDYEIAVIEFNNFKKASPDTRDIDALIKTCQDSLSKK